MSIEFEDNSVQVKQALSQAEKNWIEETAMELKSQTQALSRVNTGQTKGSYDYVLESDAAYVGSPLENAIWEEYGTGEYAVSGNGRKGGWWIKVGSGSNEISEATVSRYHFKTITIKGQKFAFTRGKKPSKPLESAFDIVKPKAEARADEVFGGIKD